jgi:hypothetical protein
MDFGGDGRVEMLPGWVESRLMKAGRSFDGETKRSFSLISREEFITDNISCIKMTYHL